MSNKRVLIVRHGETDYNVAGRWQGQLDIPLNDNGRKQAQALAQYLQNEGIEAIYSSDSIRCADTAKAIAAKHNLDINLEPRIREFNLGVMEGLLREEMEADSELKEVNRKWRESDDFVIPNGESRNMTQARAYQFWQEVVEPHVAKTILVVSHGGTSRMLFRKLFGDEQKFHFANTSLSILELNGEAQWEIIALNTTPHLDETEE